MLILIVYQDSKDIVDLFSGTDADSDFQTPYPLQAKAVLQKRPIKHKDFEGR